MVVALEVALSRCHCEGVGVYMLVCGRYLRDGARSCGVGSPAWNRSRDNESDANSTTIPWGFARRDQPGRSSVCVGHHGVRVGPDSQGEGRPFARCGG